MKKTIGIIVVVLVVLGVGFYFIKNQSAPIDQGNPQVSAPAPTPASSPSTTTPPPQSTSSQPSAPAPKQTSGPVTHATTIQNFAFSEPSITIHKGDTVVWTNKDSA